MSADVIPLFDAIHLTPERLKEIKHGCRNAWQQQRKFFGIYYDDADLSPIERQVIARIAARHYE